MDKDEKPHDTYLATEHALHSPPPATPPSPPQAEKDFTDIPLSEDPPTQSQPSQPSQPQLQSSQPLPPQSTALQQGPTLNSDTDAGPKLRWWQEVTFSYVIGLVQKAQKYAVLSSSFPTPLLFTNSRTQHEIDTVFTLCTESSSMRVTYSRSRCVKRPGIATKSLSPDMLER
jgi:hypothetical protein